MTARVEGAPIELWPGAMPSPGWHLDDGAVAVTVTEVGAHLSSVTVPAGDDRLEITVGYPPSAAWPRGAHGASIGRYANRIAGARFELDGVTHQLAANEGANQLHGGPMGFDRHRWQGDAEAIGSTARVELAHHSPAGDQGFPGAVSAAVVFELDSGVLTISYTATTDAATPINLTNHVYWNLAGSGPLAGHELAVDADRYVAVDAELIPLPGPPCEVSSTRFDCREPRALTAIESGGGYDHCFVLDHRSGSRVASLQHPSGRQVLVTTDRVGLQVYTGRHLPADGRGVALETQCLPDTPNRPEFGDATVRPGQTYRASTSFELRW